MNPNDGERAAGLLQQARVARGENRPADAAPLARTALELARGVRDVDLLARALNMLAQVERDLGHRGAAVELYMELEDLHRDSDHARGVAHALRHQADIQQEAGLGELADALYAEALALYRGAPETSGLELANALRGRALLKSRARRPGEARPLWEEALSLYASAGVRPGVDECEFWLKSLAGR